MTMQKMTVDGIFADPIKNEPSTKRSSGNSNAKETKTMPKGTSKSANKSRKGTGGEGGAAKARKGSKPAARKGSGGGTTGNLPAKVPSASASKTVSGRKKPRTTSGLKKTVGAPALAAPARKAPARRASGNSGKGTAATVGYAVGGAGIGILGDVLISNTFGAVTDSADEAQIVNNRWARGVYGLAFSGLILGYQLLSKRFFPRYSMSTPLAFGAVTSAAALGLFNMIRYFGSGKGLYGSMAVAGPVADIGFGEEGDDEEAWADEYDDDMEVSGLPLSNIRTSISDATFDAYVASQTADAIEELNSYVEQLNNDLDGFFGPMTLDQSDVIANLQSLVSDAEDTLILATKQLELGGVAEARRSAEAAATTIDRAMQMSDALKAGVQSAEPTVDTDQAGNAITSATDGMGNTTTTVVDQQGNASVTVTDANGNVIASNNVPANGNGGGNFANIPNAPGNFAQNSSMSNALTAMRNNANSNMAVNTQEAQANAGQPGISGGYHIVVNHEQLGDLSVAAPPPEHVFSQDQTVGTPLVVFQNLVPWSYDAAARINAMTGAQPGTPGYTTPEQVALAYFFWFKYQTGERGYQFGIAPLNANGGGQWANGWTSNGPPQQAFATVSGSEYLPMGGTDFDSLAAVTHQIFAGLAN